MSWNYRVVRRVFGDEVDYGIHEMYSDPYGRTVEPVPVVAESLDALRVQLAQMLLALDRPVIDDTPSEES